MIDRLICLILTLPVSTTTTERIFSANERQFFETKMGDEFLAGNLVVYIENDIASLFTESVIAEFNSLKRRELNFS